MRPSEGTVQEIMEHVEALSKKLLSVARVEPVFPVILDLTFRPGTRPPEVKKIVDEVCRQLEEEFQGVIFYIREKKG